MTGHEGYERHTGQMTGHERIKGQETTEYATTEYVVLVVFAPAEATPQVLAVLAAEGAGSIGDYSGCSWSVTGTGRFTPGTGAQPAIGSVGLREEVIEDRIEVVCPRSRARNVLEAMIRAHPYEQPAYHAYPMLLLGDL